MAGDWLLALLLGVALLVLLLARGDFSNRPRQSGSTADGGGGHHDNGHGEGGHGDGGGDGDGGGE